MKKFIKESWFKLVISVVLIVISGSCFYYFVVLSSKKEIKAEEQNKIQLLEKSVFEQQKNTEESLAKAQKEKTESIVNNCIVDAYTELKTLQANFDWMRNSICAEFPDKCNVDLWNKAKDDAFITYKEEWVPQCKLGQRVFIHYKPYK